MKLTFFCWQRFFDSDPDNGLERTTFDSCGVDDDDGVDDEFRGKEGRRSGMEEVTDGKEEGRGRELLVVSTGVEEEG